MRQTWTTLRQQTTESDAASGETTEVLVEYDGPQLVLTRGKSGACYLSVASDADESAVRWLHAPVTSVQLAALKRGATTLFDVFRDAKLDVVDVAPNGDIVRAWVVGPDELDVAHLPLPAAPFPISEAAPKNEIELMLGPEGHAAIPLDSLGIVASRYQAVWTQCALAALRPTREARSTVTNGARLDATSAHAGSFVLHTVPADDAISNSAADVFRKLVQSSTNHVDLDAFLASNPIELRDSYMSFLVALRVRNLQILATWAHGAAFVGRRQSRLGRTRRTRGESTHTRSYVYRGFFRGFSLQTRTFEFDGVQAIRGGVSPDCLAHAEKEGVVVGEHDFYRVTVSETTLDTGQVETILVRLEPYGEDEYQAEISEMVGWFLSNYEEAAPFPSEIVGEGLYPGEGPYDAWDELSANFPDADAFVLEGAVEKLHETALDWVRRNED